MSLGRNTGSQSAPNTRGWQRARAPVVAYLGHDDFWHPEHLASLLSVLSPRVDIAHGVTLWLGANEDDRLEISGVESWHPGTFVPPSSVAHWRCNSRIGSWVRPGTSGMPVDYAFLMTSQARGARFASSGEPTVFKFPAAWRLDSYRTRDVSPQVQLRQRLISDPQLGLRLLRAASAAGVPRNLLAPPSARPGVLADHNRRFKGLPARFGPPLTRWSAGTSLLFPGWHAPERDRFGSFSWIGPRERAFVRLDPPDRGELGVRVIVRHVLSAEQLDRLVVDIDGTAVALQRSAAPDGATVLTGWLGRAPRNHTIEVGLATSLVRPSDVDPNSSDERLLGVAVSEIRLLARHARLLLAGESTEPHTVRSWWHSRRLWGRR